MDLQFSPEREGSTDGKCSQPHIVNVKWGEQANALTDHVIINNLCAGFEDPALSERSSLTKTSM